MRSQGWHRVFICAAALSISAAGCGSDGADEATVAAKLRPVIEAKVRAELEPKIRAEIEAEYAARAPVSATSALPAPEANPTNASPTPSAVNGGVKTPPPAEKPSVAPPPPAPPEVAVAPTPDENTAPVVVKKIVLAAGVENREPIGLSSQFTRGPGKAYCYITIPNLDGAIEQVSVVWAQGGVEKLRTEMAIKKSRAFRTWAHLRLDYASRVGAWECRVLDQRGQKIASASFEIVAAPKAPDALPD